MKAAYRNAVLGFSALFVVLGVAMLVVTALHGGGIGYLLGALFVALGLGRARLATRGRPGRRA
jgi:hypothetical protein